MKVKIKRYDNSLPLPSYKTSGAAAVDLYSRGSTTIKPQQVEYIPLNIAVAIPSGNWGLLVARSSLHKMGLMLINGIGVIDSDYSGDADEVKLAVFNFTADTVIIENGTRVAQMIILPTETIEWIESESLSEASRGGFGSTGEK